MPPMKEENPHGCLGQTQTLPADLFRKSSGPRREKVRAKLRNLFNAPTGAENIPRGQQLPRFLPFEERAEWRKANAVTLTSGAAFPSYKSNRFKARKASVNMDLCFLDDYSPSPQEYTEPDILMKVLHHGHGLDSKTSLSAQTDEHVQKKHPKEADNCHSHDFSSSSYISARIGRIQSRSESPVQSVAKDAMPDTQLLQTVRKLRISSSSPGVQGTSSAATEHRISRSHSSSSRKLSSTKKPRNARRAISSSNGNNEHLHKTEIKTEMIHFRASQADETTAELEEPRHRCPTAHTFASSYRSCQTSIKSGVLDSSMGATQVSRCNAISDKTDSSVRELRGQKSTDRRSSDDTSVSAEPSVLELPSPVASVPLQKPAGKGRLQTKNLEARKSDGQAVTKGVLEGDSSIKQQKNIKKHKHSLITRARQALSRRRRRIQAWLKNTRESWHGVDAKAELRKRKKKRQPHAPLLRPVRSVFGLRNISSDTVVVQSVEKEIERRASDPVLRPRYSVFSFRSGVSTRRGRV
ncbi:hypothetical protein VDBG_00860 [Verticillium alfalfae VaMs.102]|uniref:Uncharacterized protein n=1 Tax=Verticillium alfalfae (strain VaMs.102 / ATCC MYA-4576 / FGSC 10136) TaxID=526221 RepID=C9S7J0_VERA1|nr:hypothetical protein VDBG_00860 [Verticillium alfalfae VaMs.102]EEY14751.1 hypothetical protein VDBG_00860 [Verticillium alfalfae VaMs.102]